MRFARSCCAMVLVALAASLGSIASTVHAQQQGKSVCSEIKLVSAMMLKQRHEGTSKDKLMGNLDEQSVDNAEAEKQKAFIKSIIEDAYAQSVPEGSDARRKAQIEFSERWHSKCQDEL